MENSKAWDQFQSGLLVTGRRERGRQGSYLTFWSSAQRSEEPVYTRLRPVGQSAGADEAEPDQNSIPPSPNAAYDSSDRKSDQIPWM